jgi:hypothetical protein
MTRFRLSSLIISSTSPPVSGLTRQTILACYLGSHANRRAINRPNDFVTGVAGDALHGRVCREFRARITGEANGPAANDFRGQIFFYL